MIDRNNEFKVAERGDNGSPFCVPGAEVFALTGR